MTKLILEADRIIETIAILQQRIEDRFPTSSLLRLCRQLHDVAQIASQRSRWIGTPVLWIRVSTYLLALTFIACFIMAPFIIGIRVKASGSELQLPNLIEMSEAATNEVVLIGAAFFFLFTVETRIKRRRALAAIHELRSIAHIIDMHQLTKDPERLLRGWKATEHSPSHKMTPFELNRYLDYCSEMLSLTGKIAALYVQRFDDGVALAAVSEVESLCNSLSGKIWQKIMVLEQTPASEYKPTSNTSPTTSSPSTPVPDQTPQ